MLHEKQKILIERMNAYDAEGVQFYTAKQKLIAEGYSDDEIAIAVASAPFDGKANKPKEANELHQTFVENPQTGADFGRQLLINDAVKEERKARLYALGSISGGRINPVSVRNSVLFLDTLGIPIFKISVVGLFVIAVLYGMMLHTDLITFDGIVTFIELYMAAVTLWIGYVAARMSFRTWKMRQQTQSGSRTKEILGSILSILLFTAASVVIAVRLLSL